ncbi:hypothetical protein ACFVXG_20445 [Kitasatospora sp. NPDC058162]|uniref:hypothetical protein n=1 Tax=Kitasatospora sp. NPDC058162 TaxID=3346362 RepID=UPI0036D8CDF9
MGLRDLISRGAAGAAGRIARIDDRMTSERAMRKVRAEHDKWAAEVQPGVPYYTVLPTLGMDLVLAGHIQRPIHTDVVFDRRSKFGPLTGQWIAADSNATSWGLWRECGPLSTERQWTQRDQDAADAQLEARIEPWMAQEALRRFYATADYQNLSRRIEHAYPATVAAIAA